MEMNQLDNLFNFFTVDERIALLLGWKCIQHKPFGDQLAAYGAIEIWAPCQILLMHVSAGRCRSLQRVWKKAPKMWQHKNMEPLHGIHHSRCGKG